MSIPRLIGRKFVKIVWKFKKFYLQRMGVKIGNNVFISLGAKIDVRRGQIIIQDNVIITHGCYLLSHSAAIKKINPELPSKQKTEIKKDVFIGVNSVILPGVVVGEGAIIGAGSFVTQV